MDQQLDFITPSAGYWRIDWFGSLSYFNQNGEQHSQPLVEVFISRLKSSPWELDIYNPESTAHEQQQKIVIPISYLTVLRIGDIWSASQLVHSPCYKTYTLNEGQWSTEEVTTVKAADQISFGNYYLPWKHHPYHKSSTQTLCEKVITTNGHVVLIPSWVILQAYFSSCSFLFTQLFQFGMQFDRLYDPEKSWLEGTSGHLRLKKWVRDSAAKTVARIAWDKKAQIATKMVSDHLAIQSSNRKYLTPKTTFPFSGSSRMKLRGRYISQAASSKSRPLVFIAWEILSCTSKPPITDLTFYRDNPGKNSDSSPSSGKGMAQDITRLIPGQKKPVTGPEGMKLVADLEPSNKFLTLNLESGRSARTLGFDTLESRKEFLPSEDEKKTDTRTIHPEEETSFGAPGTGRPNGEDTPVSFSEGSKVLPHERRFRFDYPICRLSIFQRICRKIAACSSVLNLRFVSVNNHFPQPENAEFSYLPAAFTINGREKTWRKIHYRKGKSNDDNETIRRALIAEIQLSQKTLYIIEVERRIDKSGKDNKWVELDNIGTVVLSSSTRKFIAKSDLNKLLHLCSDQNGIWSPRKTESKINIEQFSYSVVKHPSDQTVSTPDSHDTEVIRSIESAAGASFE